MSAINELAVDALTLNGQASEVLASISPLAEDIGVQMLVPPGPPTMYVAPEPGILVVPET